MADSRSYRAILEQLGRHWIWISLIAGVLVLVAVTGFLRRAEPPATAEHAFAIPPVQGRLMVEVLNGTQKQGAARTATRMLRSHGVDVVFLGNADSASGLTQVIVRRGDPERARTVAAVLRAGKILVETDTFRRVDVSVILGDDFRPRLGIHP